MGSVPGNSTLCIVRQDHSTSIERDRQCTFEAKRYTIVDSFCLVVLFNEKRFIIE